MYQRNMPITESLMRIGFCLSQSVNLHVSMDVQIISSSVFLQSLPFRTFVLRLLPKYFGFPDRWAHILSDASLRIVSINHLITISPELPFALLTQLVVIAYQEFPAIREVCYIRHRMQRQKSASVDITSCHIREWYTMLVQYSHGLPYTGLQIHPVLEYVRFLSNNTKGLLYILP